MFLSTALFALAHLGYGQPFMLIGVTLLSLLYAELMRRRGSIWAPVAAHAIFDLVQLLVVVPLVAWRLEHLDATGPVASLVRRGVRSLSDENAMLDCRAGEAVSRPECQFHLALGSRFENIELVQVVLDESLRRLACDDDTRYWVGIAVREAVANAIKHGNHQDPNKKVEIDLRVEGEDLVVSVLDEGNGFDPGRVADPLKPENLLKPDGRGIFYMGKFMDGVEYRFRDGGGTEVTLRKRITSGVEVPEAEYGGRTMKIGVRQRQGVTVLEPKGKITIGSGDIALRDSVIEALDSGSRKILINLKDVSTIDSSGIGELVAAYTTVTNRGGKLKLVGLPPKVSDILQITQLVTVFEVMDSEEEAVDSF